MSDFRILFEYLLLFEKKYFFQKYTSLALAFEKAPSRCYYHCCCGKKRICANPAHHTISTTPVGEFRNANAITKFIGVFIAADLWPFSVVDEQAVLKKKNPLNYEPYRDLETELSTEM